MQTFPNSLIFKNQISLSRSHFPLEHLAPAIPHLQRLQHEMASDLAQNGTLHNFQLYMSTFYDVL